VINDGKKEKINELFNTILFKLDHATDEKPNEFISDTEKLLLIINDEIYAHVLDFFWKGFKKKYGIKENFESYFSNKVEAIKVFYSKCISPLNLKMDVISSKRKYKSKTNFKITIFKLSFSVMKKIKYTWISILGTLIMLISIAFSRHYSEIGQEWISDLFFGIASSILSAIIITKLNSHIKKEIKYLKQNEQKFEYYTEQFLTKCKSNNEIAFEAIDNNQFKNFMLIFVETNNVLNDYLNRIKSFNKIKYSNEYQLLVKFEKEIFNYSSNIVKREYTHDFRGIRTDEINQLQMYLIELIFLLDNYKELINTFMNAFKKDLSNLENKVLD
jgi:hypothetical protein